MTRTAGATNIKSFNVRTQIESTSSGEIKHLSGAHTQTALDQFRSVLKHHKNYINWIESRHRELISLKAAGGARAPKDSTYKKYMWYAEQNTLLEAINAFEVFYKRTVIDLAKSLRNYVPAERLKGAVESRVLWTMRGRISIASLIFEHQLYHDLDIIDAATYTLIQSKRYNRGSPQSRMAEKNRRLQAIFQIRHTLSHNYGLITRSDQAKFKFLGFDSQWDEIIDPSKNDFGTSISRFIEQEAIDFTQWLISETSKYLSNLSKSTGVVLDKRVLTRIEQTLGDSPFLSKLEWV